MISFKQSDLDELRNERRYLSDVFIEFYFTYLSSIHPSNSILFVPPTISFLLANSEDEDDIEDCVKPLGLPNKDLIFFPVNNGGIHWSLLVYTREFNVFAHHDSLSGLNNTEAKELYLAVRDCVHETESLRYRVEFRKKRRHVDGLSCVPGYVRASTPRQTNGFDCGLYVMAMAKVICTWFCSGVREGNWLREIDKLDGTVGVTMRPLVLQLIRDASEGRLGSVSCSIEEERCDDKIEELTSEEIELQKFWADFDDPVDTKTSGDDLPRSDPVDTKTNGDDLPRSSEAGKIVANNSTSSQVKEKSENEKTTPLIKVEGFNDSEMVHQFPSCDTSASSSIVEEHKPEKSKNEKTPLIKVEGFNDIDESHQFPSCDSTSASSSIVEEHKPVVSDVETEEMENVLGTTTSDCRTSGGKREYLTQWPPEEKSTVEVKRGPRSLLW